MALTVNQMFYGVWCDKHLICRWWCDYNRSIDYETKWLFK